MWGTSRTLVSNLMEGVTKGFENKLAGPEVAAIVEYIKSLQSNAVRTGPSEGPAYAPVRGR